MTFYRVKRVETVTYVKDYTREELVEMGVPAEVFTDGDLTADFKDAVYTNHSLDEALTEGTERHGDVQGNEFSIRRID